MLCKHHKCYYTGGAPTGFVLFCNMRNIWETQKAIQSSIVGELIFWYQERKSDRFIVLRRAVVTINTILIDWALVLIVHRQLNCGLLLLQRLPCNYPKRLFYIFIDCRDHWQNSGHCHPHPLTELCCSSYASCQSSTHREQWTSLCVGTFSV